MKLDAQPPHPGDSFDSVVGWEWAARITQAVKDIDIKSQSFVQIVNPPPISFTDDVPLVMSNTTLAELVYRSASKSITLANGLVDLLAINVITKLATFAAGGVFGGSLTVNAGGATITGGLTVTSGGSSITGSETVSNAITAQNNISTANGNFLTKDGQGIIFNSNTGGNSFIRHMASGMQFWTPNGMVLNLLDSTGFQIAAATFQAATAGGASPLPAQPDRYLSFGLIGPGAGAPGLYRIPLYL